jgi:hypothetical protein
MDENQGALIKLDSKIDKLCTGMDFMNEKQEQMADDIGKIKEAVYNPDSGIYARIRELESWKATSSKMIWILFTTVIGVFGALVLKYFT